MNSSIFFVQKDPFVEESNSVCVDFLKRCIRLPHGDLVPFDVLLLGKSERIANKVSMLLSQLNVHNHSIRWWSYIFTAKNPLSSPLFNELIDIILILELSHQYSQNLFSIYVVNARYSQRLVISRFFEIHLFQISSVVYYKLISTFRKIYGFTRAIFLVCTTTFFAKRNKQIDDKKLGKIGILTFIDGSNRGNQDPFFGKLINQLKEVEKISAEYIFFMYRPFKARKTELGSEKNSFIFLFNYLTWNDIFWTVSSLAKELFTFYKNQLVLVSDR